MGHSSDQPAAARPLDAKGRAVAVGQTFTRHERERIFRQMVLGELRDGRLPWLRRLCLMRFAAKLGIQPRAALRKLAEMAPVDFVPAPFASLWVLAGVALWGAWMLFITFG